ncbi:MAG: ribosomal protein L7/L12 [Rhodoglobus sp.]
MPVDDQAFATLQAEVARQKTLIDNLYKHLGIGQLGAAADGEVIPDAVTDAIRAGQLIAAIKAYRQFTGLGLKDAKDRVEEIARGLQ